MVQRQRKGNHFTDVPRFRFADALSETWFQVSYASYHLAYVRVYSQSSALWTDKETLSQQTLDFRMSAQADITICRTHLAAFFWQIDHFFEVLESAINRGKQEHPQPSYFEGFKEALDRAAQTPLRKEISAYRNMSHQVAAVIGIRWEDPTVSRHLFLPTLDGYAQMEEIDMNTRLQTYFEFVATIWLSFAPCEFKEQFPRDFTFPVTVPYLFSGDLPIELRGVPHLQVTVQSCKK